MHRAVERLKNFVGHLVPHFGRLKVGDKVKDKAGDKVMARQAARRYLLRNNCSMYGRSSGLVTFGFGSALTTSRTGW